MRFALALLLIVVPVSAQQPFTIPRASNWVGVVEMSVRRGRVMVPTHVDLVVEGDEVSGQWRTITTTHRGSMTGTVTGSITDGRTVRLKIGVVAGAEIEGVEISANRCRGEGSFSGTINEYHVLKMTAPAFVSDTAAQRHTDTHCASPQKIVFTLIPHE